MKKLLGVLLAMTLSWPVSATVLHNVEVKGEIQTIASDVRHGDVLVDYNRGAWTRAMVGMSADLVEDVTVNLLGQYAYAWGTNNENLYGFGSGRGGDKARLVNANVALHNLFCAFDLTVGRQFYGDEDSAVMYFGPNHYNAEIGAYAQAIDAAKLVYSDDVKTFTMIAGTIYDDARVIDNTKINIYGADLKVNLTNAVTAQVYGYDLRNTGDLDLDGDGIDEDKHEGFYGAKLGMNVEAFRASAEYARDFGGKRLIKEHKGTGYMVKADLATDIKAVTARGTFLYAKEGFEALGNYTPGLLIGHVLGGDIWDYSNKGIRLFNLGFDFKPAEKWVFSLDGYTFQARTGHATTYEADLTAKYNHNEYVQLFAGVGYAKYTKTENYTDFQKDNFGRDNVKGQLGMLIKF